MKYRAILLHLDNSESVWQTIKTATGLGLDRYPEPLIPGIRRQSIALETSSTALVLGLVLPIPTFCAFTKLQLKDVIKMITIFFIAVNFYYSSKMKI